MEKQAVVATRPFLTFRLGGEIYALEIFQVREVLKPGKMTRIPRTPAFMLGVINLRGGVVPVIDLSQKFGLVQGVNTQAENIIILELTVKGDHTLIGALVDVVQEVVELETSGIESVPRIGMTVSSEFVRGIGKKGDDFLIILDMEKIFSEEELVQLTGTHREQEEAAQGSGV